ncbi:MAG: NUDIX domain-containing protein [Clostridiales bacterium]
MNEKEFLDKYDSNKYEKPSVTVDMNIFSIKNTKKYNYRKLPDKKLNILLVKRKTHPFLGKWALPGGFVSIDEDLDIAAKRELKEETGVDKIYMEQLYTWGDVNRDPRMRVLSCSYMSLVDSSKIDLIAGDDAEEAEWFELEYNVLSKEKNDLENGYKIVKLVNIKLINNDMNFVSELKITKEVYEKNIIYKREILSSDNIAFDHIKIISYALERLRNKLEYTDVVFNLMDKEFTLSELQKVYEVILGKKMLTAAFRRKIINKVMKIDKFTKDAGHRPSQLYNFNPKWEE